jgi:hypothetical protein
MKSCGTPEPLLSSSEFSLQEVMTQGRFGVSNVALTSFGLLASAELALRQRTKILEKAVIVNSWHIGW